MKQIGALLVSALLVVGATTASFAGAERDGVSGATARTLATRAEQHGTSRALSTLDPLPPHNPKPTSAPVAPVAPLDLGGTRFVDGALYESDDVTAPGRATSFEGISQTGIGAPPDPVGDVGPGHYVQAVNGAFAVWNKSGSRLYGPARIETLWEGVGGLCRYRGRGDPIVQYDGLARRWVITQFAFRRDASGDPVGPFYQCFAISKSANPVGRYELYGFLTSTSYLPDYPKLGVWRDGYYMTVHLFHDGDYKGQGIYAFDRAAMLDGRAAYQPIGFRERGYYGVLPADVDGNRPPPEGAPNYLIGLKEGSSNLESDHLQLIEFRARWSNPAASTLDVVRVLPTAPFDTNLCYGNLNCIPQRGTSRRLDPMSDGILMYRLAYRNFGTHRSLVMNHVVDVDGSDHAGIRWYEVRQPGDDAYINLQGTYAPDSSHRWIGSIAMDRSGNIAMGYSVSDEDLFPSIRYTGRLDGDAAGTMAEERTLYAGRGAQTGSSRWGDYSSLSVDPSDGCTFWYTQEYYRKVSRDSWRTRIGTFRFPQCGPQFTAGPERAEEPPPPLVPQQEETKRDERAPGISAVADHPDPFYPDGDGARDFTRISFELSERAEITVEVFNRRHRLVRRLSNATLSPGSWYARWFGNNSRRSPAPPGLYRYRIRAEDAAGNARSAWGKVALRR